MAPVKAVKLPRYVMFKGDNGYNLCLWPRSYNYLQFNSTSRELWGIHEVIPVPGQENVVMIKSVHNQQFWRTSPNWIWADQSEKPSTNNLDCLFKVVQISPKSVGLQLMANKRYLKRLTTDGKESCLNAAAPDCFTDITAQLEVSEALLTRRVFDVKYELNQLQTTDMKPIVLGSAKATNNTRSKTDLSVTVAYEVETQVSWSNSNTITTGLSVTVTAGIPDVASASATVSTEITNTVEMGKVEGKKNLVSSTFTVKDVAPGDTVRT